MTKDTDEFLQFAEPVTCREYTLPRDEKSSDPKGWNRGNTKIGPVLEVTTSYLQGKIGVETRVESDNKDISHSWVRISHGLNKLVTDLSNKEFDDNEQETSEMKTEVFAFASRSKAKAKPRRPSTACSSSRTVPIREKYGLILNQELNSIKRTQCKKAKHSSSAWTTTSRGRWGDRILETEDYLRNKFEHFHHWSDDMWKSKMVGGGGNKKNFNIVLIQQDKKFFISELFKVIQDAIPLILHYRTMC